MKKSIVISFVFLFLFVSVIGCTDLGSEVKVTVDSKRYSDSIGTDWSEQDASDGYTFFIVKITVENVGDERVHTNPIYTTISTTDGQTYDYSGSSFVFTDHFDAVDVQPGNKQTGTLAYEIPKSATPDKFFYNDFTNDIEIDL